jgi:hypothetical protein
MIFHKIEKSLKIHFSVSGVELVGEAQSNRIDFDDEQWNDESADFRLVNNFEFEF